MAEPNFELPEESRRALYECFAHFDKSGDGVIDRAELPDALRFAGINPTQTNIDSILKLFDTNGDGKLQIDELVDNWYALCQHSVNGDELLEAFNTLDLDKDGFIRLDELGVVLRGAGERWSAEEVSEMVDSIMKYDKNGDGKFAYPEFVAMWSAEALPRIKAQNDRLKKM